MIPLALAKGGRFRFTGSERLISRGIDGYRQLFRDQDILCETGPDSIIVEGKLKPGELHVDVSQSSQYLTGVMLALTSMLGRSKIVAEGKMESRSYIDITMAALKMAGPSLQAGRTLTVEGDWSNAAFLEAFNFIGGGVEVIGLNPDSVQGDRRCLEYFKALKEGFANIDISEQIDLGPVLFAVAALLHGGKFTGTRRLALKESDRASAMMQELSKFGVRGKVEENSVTIEESALHAPDGPLEGHNDHRVVMALCLPLSVYGGSIKEAEAVRKSYPEWFEVLRKLGIETTVEQ